MNEYLKIYLWEKVTLKRIFHWHYKLPSNWNFFTLLVILLCIKKKSNYL